MDVVGKKVESQVQFWSLLGPFFVLLSIAVLLFKVSPHWYFPISALIGIPLCVKWKMKGMAAALCCLFLLAGISYQNLELDDRYWHVGLSLAMAFSFIVLTLSLEEVQGLVSKLQLESQSRLDNFLLLDEKWKNAEQEWSLGKEQSKAEIATLTQEFAKIQEDKQTFYKLAQLAKDELVQVRGQHDLLLQDLLYKKQQIAQLHERLDENEMTIQGFVNSDSEKQMQALKEQVACLEREKEICSVKIARAQEETQACQVEKEHIWRELQACQEREKLCLMDQHRHQQDRQDQHYAFQSLQSKCTVMEHEKQTLAQAQTKLQQQCEQLRQLEAQQRQAMQQAQRKIQELEIKLLEGEKQKDSFQLRRKELDEQSLLLDKQTKQREEQYKMHVQQLQRQLEEEKNKAEAQLKQHQQLILQQSQHEHRALQERYHKVHEDYMKARQDFELAQDALNHIRKKEDHYKLSLSQLQEEVEEHKKVAAELKQNQEEKKVLTQEIKTLQEHHQAAQEELQQVRQNLEAKSGTLAQMQEKICHLSNELQEQKSCLKQSEEQIQRLENLKLQLEQALQQTQAQLQQSHEKKDLDRQKHKKLPYAAGNTRQIESMYIQLKDQFQEKCHVLDATRRELFRVNEQLMKYQKDDEEEQIFSPSANETQLQRHIVQLGRQFEQMQALYQQEVDELTVLVGHLLGQIKT